MKENECRQYMRNIKTFLEKTNDRSLVQDRSWIRVFLCFFILGILLLALFNYYVDPYNYFNKQYTGDENNSQYYKVKYVLGNPTEYDCFILGGSNSGVLDPEQINDYTNYKTYSMTFTVGNWYNYYLYTRFLIEHTDVCCIILHLSSTEVNYDRESTQLVESRRAPAITKCNIIEELKETGSFLLKSIKLHDEKNIISIKKNGMYDWSTIIEQEVENPGEYTQRYVLSEYEETISKLDDVTLDSIKIEEALVYAEQVKKLCDDNDVELIVINGPVFISKRA